MKIVSLNIALPSVQRYGEQELFTGGVKKPVPGAVLRFTNFEGDGQADRRNHGGPDKAVCVYPLDHYPHWEKRIGRPLPAGAFSENLTVSGAVETRICIGDVFAIGGATVQVSQPRMPCTKLAGKNDENLLPKWMADTGYTGFYLRVLSEGPVHAGDDFELLQPHPGRIAIADVNGIIYGRSSDVGLVERLANLPEFAENGRAKFAERLRRLHDG